MLPRASASRLRVSDEERERVAEFLRDRCAEGRLGADELEERLEAAYGGRTVGDLEGVVWDLPGGRAVLPSPWGRPGSGLAWTRSAPPSPRRPLRPAVIALVTVAVVVVGLAALPKLLALVLIAVVLAVALSVAGLALALAPALLLAGGLAWLARRLLGRALEGRQWRSLAPPGDRERTRRSPWGPGPLGPRAR